MNGSGQIQGKAFGFVIAGPIAALVIGTAMSVRDYMNAPFKGALANARTEAYSAEQFGPFCLMEGVWHNWEEESNGYAWLPSGEGECSRRQLPFCDGSSSDFEFRDNGYL